MENVKITGLTEDTAPALENLIETVDDPSGTPVSRYSTMAKTMALLGAVPGGRLTLTTGVPVTTSDVTAATTLYYAPHHHNLVRLYDGTSWKLYTFAERSIAIPATTATNYDVFLYDNSGTLTLELTAWTNDSTRATTLTRQDGVLVKTGAPTRLYLGTVRTTGTSGQTEDSFTNRYVWNMYNRHPRGFRIADGTSHTYATATYRPWNNDTAVRVTFVTGQSILLRIQLAAEFKSSADGTVAAAGMGIDSTSANDLGSVVNRIAEATSVANEEYNEAAAGYHYLQVLEYSGTGTATFYVARMNGEIWG